MKMGREVVFLMVFEKKFEKIWILGGVGCNFVL